MYGLPNPAKLPTELISPTEAAAIDGLRISVGSDQNTDKYAFPAVTSVSCPTNVHIENDCPINPHSPAAAINIGIAMCQRLSICLSECHAFMGITIKHTKIAPSSPTLASASPENRFSIVGI